MFKKKNPFRKYTDDQLVSELITRWELRCLDSLPGEYQKEVIRRRLGGRVLDEFNREEFLKVKEVIEKRLREIPEDNVPDMLESFRKVISLDLAYSHIAEIAYLHEGRTSVCHLPTFYYSLEGEKVLLAESVEETIIQGKYLIHTPYQTDKWLEAVKREENLDPAKFEEDISSYYPGLDMIIQGNGSVHRMAEAYVDRFRSVAQVRRYDDAPLYEHVETDGSRWISHGKEIGRVTDFRLAVVFAIRAGSFDLNSFHRSCAENREF